jgi:hypothetical protein
LSPTQARHKRSPTVCNGGRNQKGPCLDKARTFVRSRILEEMRLAGAARIAQHSTYEPEDRCDGARNEAHD